MQNENLKRQLRTALNRYYKQNHGYNQTDIDEENPFNIEEKVNQEENYTDVYVYAEITISEFFDLLQPELDKVVQKFDDSAYFDVVDNGEYMARVYWDTKTNSSAVTVMTNRNLINLANKVCDIISDDYNDEFVTSEIEFNDDKIFLEVIGDKNESRAYIDVPDASLISTYQDLEDEYLDQLIDSIETNMENL